MSASARYTHDPLTNAQQNAALTRPSAERVLLLQSLSDAALDTLERNATTWWAAYERSPGSFRLRITNVTPRGRHIGLERCRDLALECRAEQHRRASLL